MTLTWIAIGFLCVLTTLVLLRPLLRKVENEASRADFDITVYRDQLKEVDRDLAEGLLSEDQAEAARTEIKRRMLAASEDDTDDKTGGGGKGLHLLAKALVVAILLGSVGVYAYLGSPEYADQPLATRDARFVQKPQQTDQPGSMEEAIAQLAARMETTPDDLNGWLMLGRSYIEIDRFEDAAKAYAEALRVSQGDPDIASNLGEVLVMIGKGQVGGEPQKVFEKALKANPLAYKARFYLALGKAQAGQHKEAVQDWADLIAISPPDAPWLSVTYEQMAAVAKGLGIDPATVKPSQTAMDLAAKYPETLKPLAPPEGEGRAPALSQEEREAISEMTPAEQEEMIRGMVQNLADRLKDNPDDVDGWMRLARSYDVLGETEKAEEIRKKIRALSNQ